MQIRSLRGFAFSEILLWATLGLGQHTPVRVPGQTGAAAQEIEQAGPGVWRSEGVDRWSGVRYVRFLTATGPGPQPDLQQPTLTGQCTQDAKGKLFFEVFANFGGVNDGAFYPPWHADPSLSPYPPRTTKVTVTMEFLGYTKVKPFKRQFEGVAAPGPAQLRYMNPGVGSANMEPPGWFFQYLRALPTLRLSEGEHSAEFATAEWLAQMHKEAMCGASGA